MPELVQWLSGTERWSVSHPVPYGVCSNPANDKHLDCLDQVIIIPVPLTPVLALTTLSLSVLFTDQMNI